MRLLNAFILGLISVSLTFEGVNAKCEIFLLSPRPLIVTELGSKQWVSDPGQSLILDESESVNLYCENGLQYHVLEYSDYHDTDDKYLKINCNNDKFWLLIDSQAKYVDSVYCQGTETSPMFESRTSMTDCEGYMSLVVGQASKEYGSLKSAAICYDIDKQQLKYISYTAYPNTFFAPTQVGQLNRLGLDIEVAYSQRLFKPYNSQSVQSALRNDRQIRLLFHSDTFEYASLIQDDSLSSVLNEFSEMLSIIWLRALLRGNWHYFLKALKYASVNAKYDVNVGVSGTVSLPMSIACNDSRPLSVELESGHIVFVPAIIWAEVRAVMPNATETDEFVIIAHNSPFLTINERNGLCKSMCHEVPWLRQSLFSKLQQYPTYGLAQCCRVADVQHKLDNFPKSVAPPKPPLPAPTEDLIANNI